MALKCYSNNDLGEDQPYAQQESDNKLQQVSKSKVKLKFQNSSYENLKDETLWNLWDEIKI